METEKEEDACFVGLTVIRSSYTARRIYTRVVHEGVHAYQHARTRSMHNATHCSARIGCHGQTAGVWKPAAPDTTFFILPPLSWIFPHVGV